MAAGQRNASFLADGCAAIQNFCNGFVGQHIDRHAHNGQRHQRCAAHGVDVRQGVGGSNAAKVTWVVHDGHEKVGRGDNGLLIIDAVHGSIVCRFRAYQQVGKELLGQGALANQLGQNAGGNLAAATTAVGQGSQAGRQIGSRRGVGCLCHVGSMAARSTVKWLTEKEDMPCVAFSAHCAPVLHVTVVCGLAACARTCIASPTVCAAVTAIGI